MALEYIARIGDIIKPVAALNLIETFTKHLHFYDSQR